MWTPNPLESLPVSPLVVLPGTKEERNLETIVNMASIVMRCPACLNQMRARLHKSGGVSGGLYVPCVWASNGKNSYLMWNNHSSSQTKIACYAYTIGGDRAKRLCKSLGGIQTGTGCDSGGDCVMYKLQ